MADNADKTNLWLRRFHPAPAARTRLICLPHAGGSASMYFSASQFMAPEVQVLAVQYPGRQDRLNEKCIDTIDQLADEIFQSICQWVDRPLTLFGHSMGATLAFEVARRLENDGFVPTGLFVSGRRAPCCRRDEKVHLRDDAGLISEVKTLSGTNSRLLEDPEVLQMILPAIRNDYKAIETYYYQPGPKLRCPIFAFIGYSDPKSTVSEARAWKEHTDGRFELQVHTGGHFYINSCMSPSSTRSSNTSARSGLLQLSLEAIENDHARQSIIKTILTHSRCSCSLLYVRCRESCWFMAGTGKHLKLGNTQDWERYPFPHLWMPLDK